MVYLNHAATSYPKPPDVVAAMVSALSSLPASEGRSSASCDTVGRDCRLRLATLFGLPPEAESHIYFSSGATLSMNLLLKGFVSERRGIMVTADAHNAVLRPLYAVREKADIHVVPCDGDGRVDPSDLERFWSDDIGLVVVNHMGNVTGAVQDISAMVAVAHAHGALLVVDCAQSAGLVPFGRDAWGADALAFTGHKALLGPPGTGGMYLRDPNRFTPYLQGGTGTKGMMLVLPRRDHAFEVGTANDSGIASLSAAVDYVGHVLTVERIRKRLLDLTSSLCRGLRKLDGVHVIGHPEREDNGPMVSFVVDGLGTGDSAYILEEEFGIRCRSGYQCAALIHSHLGTARDGTVRFSLGYSTSEEDVETAIHAVSSLAKGALLARR